MPSIRRPRGTCATTHLASEHDPGLDTLKQERTSTPATTRPFAAVNLPSSEGARLLEQEQEYIVNKLQKQLGAVHDEKRARPSR